MNYFFSKRAIPNYVVWTVTLLSTYVMKINDAWQEKALVYYLLSESFLWLLMGIVLTGMIQLGLEKLALSRTLPVKVVYLILLMVLVSVVFNYAFWPVIDILHEYFLSKPSYHGKFATRIFNWLNWIIWFVSFTAFNLYREVEEAKIKNIELQVALRESQLNTLKGQINPHFMFNSLNNIRGLILEDVTKARSMLTSLSETLRYALTQSSIDTIALEEELEIVKKYIDLSRIQLEDKLDFEMDIDAQTLSIQIPPMLMQMLVENAVKHGVSNLKEGGRILIRTQIKEEQLCIYVVNSGSLRSHKNSTQLGLQNIRKRLDLLYADTAVFSLKEEQKEVVATLKIPMS